LNVAILGIVAGTGSLPILIARRAVEQGYEVLAIAFRGFTDPAIQEVVQETVWLRLGQAQKAITALKEHGIDRVVMAGKIEKITLMKPWKLRLDLRGLRFIRSLKDWRDDTVLAAIADELLKEGITVDELTRWADKLMAPLGVLTARLPTPREWNDISFGRDMAKGIGALDIGQTVVVKNSAVIAVEAIEGTDKAIRRVWDLGVRDAVVVKMAKPQQDMRFDVPGVGPSTIESMQAAGARVLAVEAGKTMVADFSETIGQADRAGISVVGIPSEGPLGPTQ
jgi:DUF1009 family protein